MHKINIETLRDEAKRQLQQLKNLLQKAQQKGLVEAPSCDPKSRATFDTESLPKVLEVLDGETHKLEHLDMVLAVVGTMKAGKSTSINAIVGAEVLPNRNRPMTTLPTLIRHTPGVLQPRLVFKKITPLNELLVVLDTAIKVKSANPKTLTELQGDADMAALLARIQEQEPFEVQHEGEEEIFHFLKNLNDLVRLCLALEVDFPFGEYATVDTMPIIEVEFSHLKNTPATQGRLTLLDTPGPNESGQQHLRHMLKDQLKKASAVLAVLDYTQLKSDADAQVRENLMEISGTAKGRMYALVNKFDQKDRNSDDEATVKKYVVQTLMKDAINEGHVFPVSSLRGYLASRARNEIQRHGKLPAREPWVEDFGTLALGMSWDAEAAADAVHMQRAADGLWKKSGFALPLEQVIVEAHQNAALEALRSAASKLDNIARDTGDFFKANVTALKKSAANLQRNIDNLHQDIRNIADVEISTEKKLKGALQDIQGTVKDSAERVQQEVAETLAGYFKEGKRIEASNQSKKNSTRKPQKKKKPEPEQKNSLGEIIDSIFSKTNRSEDFSVQDFDPNSPIISFDGKSEAYEFMERIEKSIRNVMHKAENDCKACIQTGIDEFSKDFENYRTDALEKIKQSIQKNLDGFDIQIRLPSAQGIEIDASISDIIKNSIKEKTKRVKRQRRQDGAWGTICRWFDTDDWGWETYEDTDEYYEININKIAKSSHEGTKSLFSSTYSALNNEIYPQLQQQVEMFFGAFREKVEHVRGDLMAGIQKHTLDQARKAEILAESAQMAGEASDLEKDCTALNDSAEILRRVEGVSTARCEAIA